MVLYSENLTYRDMKSLVSGFKNTARAKDILMAYRILSTLEKYLDESESWSFNMLNNYDFQRAVRQFDLDVAIVVGARAEHLLAEIYSWNIPHLKKTIMGFNSYSSDDATILTVLVFRILNNYSTLEFTLQLALSRATLIKIHHEMSGLFSKLPGGAENSQYAREERARNQALVEAYRNFVTSLLSELESTPFESVQQELFQIVRDLRSMFYRFSDAQQNLKPLEDSKASRAKMQQESAQHKNTDTAQSQAQKQQTSSEAENCDDMFQNKQDDTFLNLNGENSTIPAAPFSANNSTSSPFPPLQEEWHSNGFSPNASSKTEKPFVPGHGATASTSTTASSFLGNSFNFSTNINKTSSSVVSSLADELPSMLQAFEMARRREEYFKQHVNHEATQSQKYSNSPPATPSRSTTDASMDATTKTPSSASTTTSFMSSPSPSPSVGMAKKSKHSATPSVLSTGTSASKNQSPIAEVATNNEQTVQVKMIKGRMMMKVDGKYVDMQEWADKTNTISEVNAQSAQHPSYSIQPTHHSMVSSSSNPNIYAAAHGEQPSSLSSSPSSATSINTLASASSSTTSLSSATSDISSTSTVVNQASQTNSATKPSPTASTSSAAQSGSAYGISSLFQPWLKAPTKTITVGPVEKPIPAPATTSAPPAESSIPPSGPKAISTLEFLQQQKQQQSVQQPSQALKSSSFMSGPTLKIGNSSQVALKSQTPTPTVTNPSQRAAMNSSSWIKGMIGTAENQFPQNYNNEMGF